MLEAKAVSVAYGAERVVAECSLAVAPRRLTALVGPNGCGKSTLLKAIMGFVPVQSGSITLDGAPLAAMGRRAIARRIAYLPQDGHAPEHMRLGDMVELAGYARYGLFGGPTAQDRALFARALDTVGLADLAGRYVTTLSGGQRQRAFLAMVLAQDADLIVMDEPVNHLDATYQVAILALVRRLTRHGGKTVLAVLHDLNLVTGFADDVAMMRGGRVVAAGPLAATIDVASVAAVFDLEADIFTRAGRLVCLPRLPEAEAPPPSEPPA
ncbi:ABC transporter ATP-binding protein [Acuticoccus sp. I52.16.1]|uniref:ABC transporter ATP-binding protein n=1 Tax=Acuticoccus sp. I52.16.1 TaxID=2928472 RepID=UPI00352D4CA5